MVPFSEIDLTQQISFAGNFVSIFSPPDLPGELLVLRIGMDTNFTSKAIAERNDIAAYRTKKNCLFPLGVGEAAPFVYHMPDWNNQMTSILSNIKLYINTEK